ncbi:MAG: HAMP domain-containing sensor histidine kinase [Eubacteriales bacterium]
MAVSGENSAPVVAAVTGSLREQEKAAQKSAAEPSRRKTGRGKKKRGPGSGRSRRRGGSKRSIRSHIMLLLIIMGIFPAMIVEITTVRNYQKRAVEQREVTVRSQVDVLADQLATRGYIDHPDDDVINPEFDMLTSIYEGRVMVVNRDGRIIKDTYNIDTGKYSLSQEVQQCLKGQETSNYDNENQYIEMTMMVTDPSDTEKTDIQGVLLVSVSTYEIHVNTVALEQQGTMIMAVIIILILIFGYFLSGILVKPLMKITKAIEGIEVGYEDEKISVADYRETQLISDAFNSLLKRQRDADETREEFVSNVSHELKTPLASMKVLSDSLNMDPNASLDMYKEFMKDISSEIDRENQIITDLLTLVRMDKKAVKLNITETNINEEIEGIVKRLTPIADKAKVKLIFEAYRPITAEVDEIKLTQAFTNIIENGIKYNKPEGGWVRISLNADRKYFYVMISDSGIGIPKESIDRIFERFYRVDKSHSREIGGTGLGLAITKQAIAMHRGAMRVNSEVGRGTTFSIRIPLIYVV